MCHDHSQDVTAPPGYDPSAFPPFAVTADIAVLTTRAGRLMVVLVERGKDPYAGRWALPGGFVDANEDLESAAIRELAEETGLVCGDLRQVGAYGDPGRDPRMRVVAVAFWTHVDVLGELRHGDDAAAARLWAVEEVLGSPDMLAFDHHDILSDVLARFEAAR